MVETEHAQDEKIALAHVCDHPSAAVMPMLRIALARKFDLPTHVLNLGAKLINRRPPEKSNFILKSGGEARALCAHGVVDPTANAVLFTSLRG